MPHHTIKEIMEEEMRKVHNYPRWRTIDLVPFNRQDMADAKVELWKRNGYEAKKEKRRDGWAIRIME